MESAPSFGQRLLEFRQARGYSQARLGVMIGITQASISAWEKDQSTPTWENVQKLESALRLADGTLGHQLGYAGPAASTAHAIAEDPDLSEQAKSLLLETYERLRSF